MYTIAFDETSNFESLRNVDKKNEPVMIAGVVYNDTSEKRYNKNGKVIDPERERIVRYYKAVCESIHTRFPKDLHVDEKKQNKEKVKKTKIEIEKSLGEFIKKGTYRDKDLLYTDGNNNIVENGGEPLKREGFYQLVVILKMPEVDTDSINNDIQRDNIASNTYLNMAHEYLIKGIFYNLSITEDTPSVVFNLPSRKLEKIKVENPEIYNKYGYGTYVKVANKNQQGAKDKHCFTITDSGYFKGLITKFSELRKIDIDEIFTKSISYTSGNAEKQAYLFLSDSVCSVLSFNNDKPYDQDVRKRMNKLNYPQKNLFFYYEGRDDYYDKAAQAYFDKDMFTSLSEIYNGRRWSSVEVKKYYRKKWYSCLEKKVFEALVAGTLEKTIDELDRYRYSDNLDQKKLLYILGVLEKASGNTTIDSRYKFKLADIGISAYTHTGNAKVAEQYYHECLKYQEDVDLDNIQRIQIRYITTLNDLFAFERARDHALSLLGINCNTKYAVTERNKNVIKRVIDWLLTREADKKNTDFSKLDKDQLISLLPEKVSRPNMYKTLSSLGQTYAFMKDPLAVYCFAKSINDIQYAPDSSMTKSFLLHWYIDNGDEENYRENAVDYFDGRSELNDQLIFLIQEGSKKREDSPRFSLGYAMFVYIKAFYTFYKNDPNNNVIAEKLIHIKETINAIITNGDRYMKNHPWEIIYKYAAMLAANSGEESSSSIRSENKRNAKEAIGKQAEFIIERILEYGDIELLSQELTSDYKIRKYHKKINDLWSELFSEDLFPHRTLSSTSEEEKIEDLRNLFTFMYH